VRDLRLAIRQLLKSPGFTTAALLSLALGIGANTAIFGLLNDVLLRTLPVQRPEELVLLRTTEGARGRMSRAGENNGGADPVTGRFTSSSFSIDTFENLRATPSPLTEVFAFAPFSQVNVLVDGAPEAAALAQFVSGNYYRGLGVAAAIGRTLTDADDRASAAPVAMISYRYWQRRFGGRTDVLGRTVTINRVPAEIVGVTAEGFDGALQAGESPDLSVTLAHYLQFQPNRKARAQPSYWWIRIMGRMAPGATPAQVRAALEPVFQNAAREGWLATRSATDPVDEPIPDAPTLVADPGAQGENDFRRQVARPLRILMGLVVLVLVAACANVANLLLARGAARAPEVALRLALGASRARLVLQLFLESLLLAAGGALAGAALAWWSRGLLLALRPFGNAAIVLDLPIDARVLGFTAAAAAATALLFGLAPAVRATRVDLTAQFQGGARTMAGGGRSRLARALMVVQVALSLVLLVSTGLFVRTLGHLQEIDAGFNRRNLVLFRLDASSAGYTMPQAVTMQARVLEAIRQIPGVRTATFSSVALLSGVRQNKRVSVPGAARPAPNLPPFVNTNGVAPNFFAALELPVLLGRGFTESDDQSSPRVGIVNQAFVRDYMSGVDPIGRRVIVGREPTDNVEVVGVARDAKYSTLRDAAPPAVYFPALQRIDGDATFAVRLASSPQGSAGESAETAVVAGIRAAVRAIDPTLPLLNLRSQDEQIERLHAQPRLFARLSALFGVVALALASVGLYGLMSHTVLRRTGEIGVRMALGAAPSRVLKMVLRESLTLVGLGVAVGTAAALLASRLVTAMLFGVTGADPLTYVSVGLALVFVALVASSLPARRASRIDPIEALRKG
jgi:predicted permease